MKNMKIYYILH